VNFNAVQVATASRQQRTAERDAILQAYPHVAANLRNTEKLFDDLTDNGCFHHTESILWRCLYLSEMEPALRKCDPFGELRELGELRKTIRQVCGIR
jgi:hypothetical protein